MIDSCGTVHYKVKITGAQQIHSLGGGTVEIPLIWSKQIWKELKVWPIVYEVELF